MVRKIRFKKRRFSKRKISKKVRKSSRRRSYKKFSKKVRRVINSTAELKQLQTAGSFKNVLNTSTYHATNFNNSAGGITAMGELNAYFKLSNFVINQGTDYNERIGDEILLRKIRY